MLWHEACAVALDQHSAQQMCHDQPCQKALSIGAIAHSRKLWFRFDSCMVRVGEQCRVAMVTAMLRY